MSLVGKVSRAKFFLNRLTKLTDYHRKCRSPMRSQWSFLQGLLRRHSNTKFGRHYDFKSIRSIKEFQDRIPLHTWEDLLPYMQTVMAGDKTALFPDDEPLLMYATTSGTTGKPKYIPVTKTSYERWGYYWDHYWSAVSLEAPRCTEHKALYFPGDPEEGYINGIPYGAITAKAYEQQNFLLKTMYPYPYQICRIKDYDIRYYTIMRLALEYQVSVAPIANPSTVLTLFRMARERYPEMIADIYDGRLRHKNRMPKKVRDLLSHQVRSNKSRARELERIAENTGDFIPRDYWPEFEGLCCFASGPLKLYLKQLREYLNFFKICDFGLLSSEGRLTFGVGTIQSHPGACPTLESNFFEFIPENEIENKYPTLLTLDQLELGQRYFIIFTNYSGLYRYNISDLMEVTGFNENTPMLTFCNKGKHMSNITGEKLSEFQVTECVRLAAEQCNYHLDDFVMCLHWDADLPSYAILKNGDEQDNANKLQMLVDCIDEQLMKMNVEYKSKRQSLRLGPLCIKPVSNNEYRLYEIEKQSAAHNISQYKHAFLVGDPSFEEQFNFLYCVTSKTEPVDI